MHKICEVCKKFPATIHLTDVKNDNIKAEMHICEHCASQKGVNVIKKTISLAQLFGKKLSANEQLVAGKKKNEENFVCERCGMSWEKYRETGRLSCANDYFAFVKNLKPILNEMHALPSNHIGKRPRPDAQSNTQHQQREYRRLLREAVAREDYREAARLRDQLQQVLN